MKNLRKLLLGFMVIFMTLPVLSFGLQGNTRIIDPLVTTSWLEENKESGNLVILDVRDEGDYAAGHIPGSVNIPFGSWWIIENDLLLELPEPSVLFDLIGSAGITGDTPVVLIQKTDGPYDRAAAARVAWTLAYGGIINFSILNGGINQWISEGRAVTSESYTPLHSGYTGVINPSVLVNKDYVMSKLCRSRIIDNRDASDFFGATYIFASRPGHIKGAGSLPTPWMFTQDGLFKSSEELELFAKGVLGPYKHTEVITYCGVGGYGAAWWFILSQVLGYEDVKLYDGSIQEWTADPDAPIRVYTWR